MTLPSNSWFDRPMRWAQLTLTEKDPETNDLHFWLNYFRAVANYIPVENYVAMLKAAADFNVKPA